MATYTVIGVRKVLADDFSHRHIVGLCTSDHAFRPLSEVIASIGEGDIWRTKCGGHEETIRIVSKCSVSGCQTAPYIETKRKSSGKDNIENLALC
jgi:hypothetical protein